MKKIFEYKTIDTRYSQKPVLKDLGLEGWELCGLAECFDRPCYLIYVFKREIVSAIEERSE